VCGREDFAIDILIANERKVIDDRSKIDRYVDALKNVVTYGEEAGDVSGGAQRLDTLSLSGEEKMTIAPNAEFIVVDGVSYRADVDSVNFLDYTAYLVFGHEAADPAYFGVEDLVSD
jgi:hypothetical protein